MPLLPTDDFGQRIQALRPGLAQTVAVEAASHASAPFSSGTVVIRVVATEPCFLALGRTPAATTTDHYLPAGAPEYFRIASGETVAVVRAAHDGLLHVSEMT